VVAVNIVAVAATADQAAALILTVVVLSTLQERASRVKATTASDLLVLHT